MREGKVNYFLKDEYWRTDLNKTQYAQVEKWIRQAGNPESTRITDTANWYKGRIDGKDLFVIYSDKPTILYEVSGDKARAELDILQRILEVIENGKGIIGIQRNIDRLLSSDWVQEKHNLAHNDDRLGGRGSNTGYAPVLQGESSKFVGSPAFRNVIKNLFEIQEKSTTGNGKEKHSLKGTVVEGELASLVKKYGAIPKGENPAREIQVCKWHKWGRACFCTLSLGTVFIKCAILDTSPQCVDKSIAFISEETGFGSIRSFNRAFKQIMGICPLEYYKQINSVKQ